MKSIIALVFGLYFSLGGMLLPGGDFSLLPEMKEMYESCKSTEDADLNPLDFVTDHVLNLDGCFDDHRHGDDQRPHSNSLKSNVCNSFCYREYFVISQENKAVFVEKRYLPYQQGRPLSGYFNDVFRPPQS